MDAAHSPPRWRVNGTLAHLPTFASAFNCHAGGPMTRPADRRVRIWKQLRSVTNALVQLLGILWS
jgi:predicted metalloendopeptidase